MKIDNSFWLFLMVVGLGWWAVTEYESNSLLKDDNFKKSKIIATQSLQFNRFNQIATIAYRHGIQTEAKSQEKVIEYREILKKELTCDLPVPQPIADGLLGYTYELRSMYANPQNTNRTSASTTATSTLTYCQAVLWIAPLLAALDKANTQLNTIREVEADRND
ncbi:hypothetical protein AB5B87_001894 [Providencia rettgeri]|uniref:hypothetical protein n=1 Tax=Providencia rettgeri TaxID=587 RepID=UPI001DFCA9D4|nr:hypothetical protein [Providencia rettgeri]EHZ7766161.1 hypothetical protein [Providencia rettgeri]EIJ7169303.1 hypothetical protein [Providencia rettgeri]EJD6047124.1 hypothetical protein [Providencia rettgeri]ELH9582983.1 hypothetical protein [Providencia rettgeri]ELM3936595.1 hypothetical protein [Providencia rettgeri]